MTQATNRTRMSVYSRLAALAVFLIPGIAAAQGGMIRDEWSVTVAPYLWAVSLDGNAGLGDVDADVDIPFADILDDLNFAAMAYIDVRKSRFGIFVNPVIARLKSDNNGDLVDTDTTTDNFLVSAGAFYRVGELDLVETSTGFRRNIGFEPYAGVRWTYLRLQVELEGIVNQNIDESEGWFDPIVGLRTFTQLSENWLISVIGDVGGFANDDVDRSWNAAGIITYRTKVFGTTANFGVGYRATHQDYDNGNFRWDVTQHGPLIGASFRF